MVVSSEGYAAFGEHGEKGVLLRVTPIVDAQGLATFEWRVAYTEPKTGKLISEAAGTDQGHFIDMILLDLAQLIQGSDHLKHERDLRRRRRLF